MKPHILIVDDSVTIRMDLRSALSAAGYAVTACDTRAAALRALKGRTFSLVILDVLLPDGDGLDLLKELRAVEDFMDVPIILLSTEVEVRHRIKGFSVGADEYIGKPYDSDHLVARANELIGKRRSALAAGAGDGAGAMTGRRILVVDDSPTYRATLTQMLRQDGCEVIPAQSGEEALALLALEQVDGVLMDLLMPGIGGMEAARRLKGSPATAHLPVVILTGHDEVGMRDEGSRIGVDDFVIKSPELLQLKARLRGLFRRRSAGGAVRLGLVEHRSSPPPERPRYSDAPPPPPSGRGESGPQSVVPGSLLDRVVTASGLSSVIGPSTIARACRRAGVEARTMTPVELERALPAIQETLRMFLSEEEHSRSIAAIASLARAVAPAVVLLATLSVMI